MAMLENFRHETRTWLSENCPQSMREPASEDQIVGGGSKQVYDNPDKKLWLDRMAVKGWTAPTWPKEYGGGGLTKQEFMILQDEMQLINARAPIVGMGFSMIGPTLLDFGSEAQKAEHLPKIATGELRWCQGYSEPGAGSDLASLQTKCVDEGDYFQVNGQKIWTSGAQYADWIFTLVRTDPQVPKHDGISFVLIDLKTAGIDVRPIKTIAGDDEFAEVFLDDVRVPMENLVGDLHDGWRVANALLAHERLGTANPQLLFDALERVKKVAKATGALDDPYFRERLAEIDIDTVGFAAMFAHAAEIANAERSLGLDASIMKINGTELLQRIADLLLEAAGTDAALTGRIDTEDGPVEIAPLFLQVRRATIYGGSSEIQRNILAKRVLNLPV